MSDAEFTTVGAELPAADMADAAAWLTRGDRRRTTHRDVVRNAFAFYYTAMATCLTCRAGTTCSVHGTAALRPKAGVDADPVSVADCRAVTDCYFAEYTKARGARPVFSAVEGKAVKDLLRKLAVDSGAPATDLSVVERAEVLIRSVYTDLFWKGKATIRTIAADPSKHLGATKETPQNRGTLQRDTGYEGAKERR